MAIILCAGVSHAQAAGIFYQSTVNPGGNVSSATVRALFSDLDANGNLLPDNTFTMTLSYLSASYTHGSFDNGGVLTGFEWQTDDSIELAIGPPETVGVITGPHSNVVSTGSGGYSRGQVIYPAGHNVSQYWAYVPTAVGAAGGDTFGAWDLISHVKGKVGGVDYGLTPVGGIAGGNDGLGSPGKVLIEADGTVDDSNAVIPTSVVFIFKVTSGQSAADAFLGISGGKFFFGSNLEEHAAGTPTLVPPGEIGEPTPVPEPGAVVAMLSLVSFGGLVAFRRRR